MPTTNLSFAKIVATPTEKAWSQAYNAGSLFLVLSLVAEDEKEQEQLGLHGKKLINALEAEFFTLEEKTLTTITHAVEEAVKDLPQAVHLSLTLAYSKDDILYLVLRGRGKVLLKRQESFGSILSKDESSDETQLITASGYLENDDLIILESEQFATSVPEKDLLPALDLALPNDIAETLSPHIHEGTEGGAAAIIISVKGVSKQTDDDSSYQSVLENEEDEILSNAIHPREETTHSLKEDLQKTEPDESAETTSQNIVHTILSRLPHVSFPKLHLSHKRKLYGTVALILVLVLLVSIYLFKSNQETSKSRQLFNDIYTQAQKEYDEGESLLSLNAPLAREDFQQAKAILEKGHGRFSKGTAEYEKLAQLEQKVDERLGSTKNSVEATAKEVTEDDAPLLQLLKETKGARFGTEDDDNYYVLTDQAITSIEKDSDKKTTLVTNDDTWENPRGLQVFSGNLYILEKDDILKFVPTATDYAQTSYFKGDAPKLNDAVSFAIDSAVWILFSDGSISKFVRGEKENFSVTGLEASFQKPTSILTTNDASSLYIVDTGAGTVTKIGKDGSYQKSYTASPLKDAKAAALSPDETTLFVLTADKFYSLSLQ